MIEELEDAFEERKRSRSMERVLESRCFSPNRFTVGVLNAF